MKTWCYRLHKLGTPKAANDIQSEPTTRPIFAKATQVKIVHDRGSLSHIRQHNGDNILLYMQ